MSPMTRVLVVVGAGFVFKIALLRAIGYAARAAGPQPQYYKDPHS